MITPEQARAELARRRQAQAVPSPAPATSGGGVTPEQARAELQRRKQQQRPDPGRVAAGTALATTQGLTGNFVDEAVGGLEGFGQNIINAGRQLVGKDVDRSTQEAYRERRDAVRGYEQGFKEEYPASAAMGNIAGSVFSPIGKMKAAGAGVGAAVKAGAKSGAQSGAVFAAGGSDADLTRGEVGQLAADTATGGALGAAAGGAISGGLGFAGRIPGKALGVNQQAVREFQEAGIDPTLAPVTGKTIQKLDRGLEQTPGATGIIQNATDRTLKQIDDQVRGVADSIAPESGIEGAGRAVQKGARQFVTGFQGKSGQLFDRVDEFVPGDSKVGVSASLDFFNRVQSELQDTPALAGVLENPKLRAVASALRQDAGGNGISYKALKGLRSKIGRELSTPQIVSDLPRSELKQLYGALSEDMRQAAAAQGPEALKAFERANNFYKAGMNRIEGRLKGLLDSDTPEKAYKAALAGTKEGATRLRAIRRSMPPEDFAVIQSQVVRDLGRATPGQQNAAGDAFSVNTFLTNWNRLSPQARDALFAGTENGPLRRSLDRLTKVAGRLKEVQKSQNTSNTAGALTTQQLYVMKPLTTMVTTAGAAGAAKLITSPKFVNWLAKGLEIREPSRMSQHISKLGAISAGDTELGESIKQYLNNLGGSQNGT